MKFLEKHRPLIVHVLPDCVHMGTTIIGITGTRSGVKKLVDDFINDPANEATVANIVEEGDLYKLIVEVRKDERVDYELNEDGTLKI